MPFEGTIGMSKSLATKLGSETKKEQVISVPRFGEGTNAREGFGIAYYYGI